MAAPVELRPLSLGEILDVAIKIYWRNAATFLAIVALVVLPVQLLVSLIDVSAFPESTGSRPFEQPQPGEPVDPEEVWLGFAAALLGGLLAVLATTIATGACFRAVADAYLGERPGWRSSLAFAARRLHSILWVVLLSGVLVALGTVLLIVPGIYLFVAFAVAVPVLLTEGLKGRRALGRSRRLVGGRWWPTFGILLVAYLLIAVLTGIMAALFGALVLTEIADDGIGYVVFNTITNGIASAITTPFGAAVVAVLYFDLRVRKEAFDLQLLAERVGVDPRPEWERPPLPAAPHRPEPESAAQPPYWPPPPGWKPPAGE